MLEIARQGISAPLPPEWEAEELDNEEIIYINVKTGEKTDQHPCDQYYRQLVIRERKKKQKMQPKGFQNPGGIGQINQGMNLNLSRNAQPPPMDPLVKLEHQKKLKKLEQQKKNQFEAKKKELIQKHEEKKDKL